MAWTFLWSDWVKYFQCPHGWSPAISWAHLPPLASARQAGSGCSAALAVTHLWALKTCQSTIFMVGQLQTIKIFILIATTFSNIPQSKASNYETSNLETNHLNDWHSKTGIKDASWSGSVIMYINAENKLFLLNIASKHKYFQSWNWLKSSMEVWILE